MKPAGKSAVMADRARGEVEGDDAQTALWRKLELFPTPPWAARAGGELINELDGGDWWAWEPACGTGTMHHGLRDYFHTVLATDIHDHGYSWAGEPLDFLSEAADAIDQVDWIVTNPPFAQAGAFVQAALRRARRGVAILARTALMESATRYPLFFPHLTGAPVGTAALYAMAPFMERVPMALGGWDPKGSTATAYAWFVWMQPGAAADMSWRTRRLINLRPEVWPIPPGTRDRLTKPDDARLFGRKGAAPLLEGLS